MVHYPGITDSHTDIALWKHMMWERKPPMHVILATVKCPNWQRMRLAMKGLPLAERFAMCEAWLEVNKHNEASKLQVANYIDALKRGGMVR